MQHNLAEILRQREGEQLDYKQRITSLEKIAKTICAFANTRGGVLLIGVNDDRSITGIDPEEEKYMLEQAAAAYCNPPVLLQYQELEDEEDRTVLLVQVPESDTKPHSCRNQQGIWQVYVRQWDKSVPAGSQLVRRLQKGYQAQANCSMPISRHEQQVLDYIGLHQRITLRQLAQLLNFSKRRAERMLYEMENKGMLRRFEHEKEDFFA